MAPADPLGPGCPQCGNENAPGARFCSTCGARLGEVDRTREERKLVSVLFVDLVDFTASADGADPEDVRDMLLLYYASARARIEEHGGALEKFVGDAVMAVFGAPVSHGDDAERAARAGLAVLAGIEELNEEHGLQLAARAAVNTGEAVVATDAAGSEDALALGDAVNTAARLQTAAPTGGLIVGPETYRATRHAVRYERLPHVDAKGKADPVPAWLAVEPLGAPAERPIARHPLVGRDRELELFRAVWGRAVSERRPQLVTLLGPPGIGKSRFCAEAAAFVARDGGRTLHGRCLPYGEQTGYSAFSNLVRAASGILESDPPFVAREKLRALVAESAPAAEAADMSRYLALLVGFGEEAESVREPRLLFFAARRLVENLGSAVPTVFVFEDLHWAQNSELELLDYLGRHVQGTAVVLVAAARPEFLEAHPGWGGGLVAHTTILLEPLAPDAAAALASHLVTEHADTSVDVATLVATAEGNPLFLEELAASMFEAKDAHRAGELPVTVRGAIAARIDALPAPARAALLSAAVIGRTFWRGVLQAAGGVGEVDDALAALERRDLVHREPTSQLAGDLEYRFKHALIQDVAYATVSRAARRQRHAAVARYVEETIEGASETLAAILAHHWREAGEPARAIPYLLAAAEAAMRGWARGAVADLYSAALELAEDAELRRGIRLQRALALVRLGEYEAARPELEELLPELTARERLDGLLALGRSTLWTERDTETIATAEEAVALARELGDDAGSAAALALQSQGYAMRGDEGDLQRALVLGDRALAEWVPGTRPFDRSEHLHLHADCTYWAGRYDRCAELSREARALASDIHSAEALLRGGGTEALALAGLGRHEEAIQIWDELFEIARELGRSPAGLLNYSSLAYRELYDLDEARRRSEEALELAAARTFSMPTRFAKSDLLLTDLLAGDVGRAQAAWPNLWEDAGDASAWTRWLIYGRLAAARAEIALRAETPESAVEWADRALTIARRTERRKYEARSLSVLGEALARLGRWEEALDALHAAVAVADGLVGAPARWQARAVLVRAAYARGDDDAAASAQAEAVRLVDGFASTLAPARAAKLLAAPAIEELRSRAGRSTATG